VEIQGCVALQVRHVSVWVYLLFLSELRTFVLSSNYLQMNQNKSKRFSNYELWMMQNPFEFGTYVGCRADVQFWCRNAVEKRVFQMV
jgi:hypothetical protein